MSISVRYFSNMLSYLLSKPNQEVSVLANWWPPKVLKQVILDCMTPALVLNT